MSDIRTVRRIAAELPETSEGTSYGTPAWYVRKKFFARIREQGVLLVHVSDEGEKHALCDAEPAKFFTVPHYDGYAGVLVRLARVKPDELGELLAESWRLRAPAKLLAAFDEEHPPTA